MPDYAIVNLLELEDSTEGRYPGIDAVRDAVAGPEGRGRTAVSHPFAAQRLDAKVLVVTGLGAELT